MNEIWTWLLDHELKSVLLGVAGGAALPWIAKTLLQHTLDTRGRRQSDERQHRGEIRMRMVERVERLRKEMVKLLCSADMTSDERTKIKSDVATCKAYLGDQIWAWTEDMPKGKREEIRDAFGRMMRAVDGEAFLDTAVASDPSRAEQISNLAGRLEAALDSA